MVPYLDRLCQCRLHAVLWYTRYSVLSTFIPLSVSLWNDLAYPIFDGVGLADFKTRAMLFFWPKLLYPYYNLFLFFPFSSFCL